MSPEVEFLVYRTISTVTGATGVVGTEVPSLVLGTARPHTTPTLPGHGGQVDRGSGELSNPRSLPGVGWGSCGGGYPSRVPTLTNPEVLRLPSSDGPGPTTVR